MPKKYTLSDGKLVLTLEPAGDGWSCVTSPLDPAPITQARSIEEAFVMAYDAQNCLRAARAKLARGRHRVAPDSPRARRPRPRKATAP